MSTWSATTASQLPSPEPSVARNSRRKRPSPSSSREPPSRTAARPSPPKLRRRELRVGKKQLEGGCEELVLLRGADRDPDRGRRAEGVQRAHDHARAQQPLEQRSGVLADVHVEEVPDGARRRLEPVP